MLSIIVIIGVMVLIILVIIVEWFKIFIVVNKFIIVRYVGRIWVSVVMIVFNVFFSLKFRYVVIFVVIGLGSVLVIVNIFLNLLLLIYLYLLIVLWWISGIMEGLLLNFSMLVCIIVVVIF